MKPQVEAWSHGVIFLSKISKWRPFRALPDPDDEGHGVGRGGGRKRTETGVRKPTGRPGPAGCGCENAHETTLPFVGRVVGYVRLYGERGRGGGGAARDRHQENFNEGRCRQKPSGLESLAEMRWPFARRRLLTRRLKNNRRGRRLLCPPTHTQAKYHQPHRAVTHQQRRAPEPRSGHFVLVGVHRRSPPEEPTGRTTGIRRCWGGGWGGLNDTDGEEAKENERKQANCMGQGIRENLGEGKREERRVPEPPSDGNNSTLHFKGQSLGISQAAVRGMEQHQPIMDKLGDPSDQTYRQTICYVKYTKISIGDNLVYIFLILMDIFIIGKLFTGVDCVVESISVVSPQGLY